MARKRSRMHKRYGRKRKHHSDGGGGGYRANPPLFADLAEFVGPGFLSFAATRFLTRVATVQLAIRKPSWGKHAGAVTSIAAFLGAWWGASRWKVTAKYTTPIVVGSAIAALQSLIQLYIPKLGWLISDATPDVEQLKLAANGGRPQLPPDLEYVDDDDPNLYTYNDQYDAGRYSASNGQAAQAAKAAGASPAAQKIAKEEDMLADLGLAEDDVGDLNLGSLGAN